MLRPLGRYRPRNVVAFSGGKDSTALVMLMAERGLDFEMLFTPTGGELPEVIAHIQRVATAVGRRLVIPPGGRTLDFWIDFYKALPNWRQRWCTRLIKILPCQAYLAAVPGSTLMVGLRADEMMREGIYGDVAQYRYPLREMGLGVRDVRAYLKLRGICIPSRTDCTLCYGQRLSEWWALWRRFSAEYAKGERLEAMYGHTFRSPHRDTWPAGLRELRTEFERGRAPRGADEDEGEEVCRVCRF